MAILRINRAIAAAGIASRRKAEALVKAGRVTLNGQIVRELKTQVDTERDELLLDGKPLSFDSPVYFLYYKPRGVVSTRNDELGRPCAGDLCSKLPGHPYPVGRLDLKSEGLMLLTNDGDVAQRLTHPSYGVIKEYRVTVKPVLADEDAQEMVSNVELEDGPAKFLQIELLEQTPDLSRLRVKVNEGRNRLIRRVFEVFGYDVRRLLRLRVGSLALGKLTPGKTRQLSASEARNLRKQLMLK